MGSERLESVIAALRSSRTLREAEEKTGLRPSGIRSLMMRNGMRASDYLGLHQQLLRDDSVPGDGSDVIAVDISERDRRLLAEAMTEYRSGKVADRTYVDKDPEPSSPRLSKVELTRILFVPDAHIPYESKAAFDLMLRVAQDFKPDMIVCLGDLGDFHKISDHKQRSGDPATLAEELAAMNARLDQLDALGAKNKLICLGNHEARWANHLADNAPEFAGLCDLSSALQFKERGWDVVDFHDFSRVGKLYVSHCLNNRTFGKNAHRSAQAKFASNVALGHTHRMVAEYVGSVTGESWATFSFGWLGDRDSLAMKYSAKADKYVDWQLGFGVGWMEPSGVVHVQPIPIIDGRAVMNGKLFESVAA